MFRYFFFILALLLFTPLMQAQTAIDAIRYAQTTTGASARTLGVGGAFGALGGDIASVSANPAGLGVFNVSEFALTPAYHIANVQSDFNGFDNSTSNHKFRFEGIGAAFVTKSEDYESNWKSYTIGVAYNQLANFNRKFSYEGTTDGSIVESFLENANGFFPEQLNGFYEGMAYDVDLIYNPSTAYEDFYAADLSTNVPIFKQETFESSGSMYDLAIGLGANYRHKLYLGAALSLPILNYTQITTYEEVDTENAYDFFNEMQYQEEFNTTGIGASLKLGAIYKINRMYRVGLTLHTPTSMVLTDTKYETSMDYNITYDPSEGATLNQASLAADPVDYTLNTPWRIVASGAALVKNLGFVSADVEWVNYGRANYTIDTAIFPGFEDFIADVNQEIATQYKPTLNVRLGAEYAKKIYRARVGYAYYGSPFERSVETIGGSRQNLSFGVGIRPKVVYLDLALLRNMQRDLYVPYRTSNSNNVQEVTNNDSRNTFVLTAGLKF